MKSQRWEAGIAGRDSRRGFESFPPGWASFYSGLFNVRKVRCLDGEAWEAAPEEPDAMVPAVEAQLMRARKE